MQFAQNSGYLKIDFFAIFSFQDGDNSGCSVLGKQFMELFPKLLRYWIFYVNIFMLGENVKVKYFGKSRLLYKRRMSHIFLIYFENGGFEIEILQ